ncbi:MAG: ABC transporter permease [Oscillospiraceae bacterium]|jgi:simple sugar transport system permease protein|nr:ABC transporter permease [Oscillospiraceae bacterium]
MKKLLKNPGFQAFAASIICIILGLLVGYIVLLFINPEGAAESILNVIKNFFTWKRPNQQLKQFGNTLSKTMPLLMCSLSILFAYKVGLFNIGTAGQYVAGACASLYAALAWGWGWLPCVLFAMLAGALLGSIVGVLKSYCNVNEVISGIMLNWISLYLTNTILSSVKEVASPYTKYITDVNPSALLPNAGLDKLFNKNQYITIAVPLALLIAIAVSVILNKTKLGYELKATGNNKNAAKYSGMAENRNIILTLVISGALAGLGAAMLYLTGYMRWECTQSSVPGMGFNGIAAAFLGGLSPIGAIFSSFFIQHITDGGQYVNTNFYSSQISDLISSVIIYLCGFVLFIKITMNNMIRKSEEKKAAKLKAAEAKAGEGGDK